MSSILALKQPNNLHPIVFEINKLVKLFETVLKIEFIWIKGHSHIADNERVDVLAKEAANLDISESIYNLFPLSFAKKHFRSRSLLEWDKEWKTISKAMHSKKKFSFNFR